MSASRCPECQASNPSTAAWCGQCYHPLGSAAPAPAAAPTPAAAPDPAAAAPSPAAAPDPDPAAAATPEPAAPPAGARHAVPAGVAGHGFRTRDGEVEWSCSMCGLFNPLAVAACAACGTPMTARFSEPVTTAAAGEPDWRVALALTVLLPGAGHVLAGHRATGAARALLFLVWLVGGLLVVRGGGSALVAGPLLLGAAAVWAGTVLDIVNLPRQGPEVLESRTLLWLVVGVASLSVVGLVVSLVGLA